MEVVVKLLNEEGMHARPAGILVKRVGMFQSKIELQYNGKTANAKSLLSIMGLGLTANAEFTIKAEGIDAELALTSLSEMVQSKFKL